MNSKLGQNSNRHRIVLKEKENEEEKEKKEENGVLVCLRLTCFLLLLCVRDKLHNLV